MSRFNDKQAALLALQVAAEATSRADLRDEYERVRHSISCGAVELVIATVSRSDSAEGRSMEQKGGAK